MIETIVSMELPVGEHLTIVRNRIEPEKDNQSGNIGRIAIVTGLHGDELEGQYICYELIRRIQADKEKLTGIVDIYPALNPLGIDAVSRNVPNTDLDMNRMFPGSENGTMMEKVAARLVDSLIGADFCLDIHASDNFIEEVPQVRISEEFAKEMMPYARMMNVDMIWTNASATVHESTLVHTMNVLGVPSLVLEMGIGNRINTSYGNQIVDGIFYLMQKMGLWMGEVATVKSAAVSSDGEIEFIRAEYTGLFLPAIENDHFVQAGQLVGTIVDPVQGIVLCEVSAQKAGLVFTMREYPIVYEGAILARILTGIEKR